MRTATMISLATGLLLSVSLPAFAQAASDAMSNGKGMANDTSMTCQDMMDKANAMTPPTDESKKTMAMKQMGMAKTAMASGNEKTCMSHMKMAMHDMM